MALTVAQKIDEIITFLELAEPAKRQPKDPWHHLRLSDLREVEPLSKLLDPMGNETWVDENVIDLADADGHLDITTLVDIPPDDPIYQQCAFGVTRTQSVKPADVRGHSKRIFPQMVLMTFAGIKLDGTYLAAKFVYGREKGLWVDANSGKHTTTNGIPLAINLQFRRRYFWRVVLGYEGRSSVSFLTDPHGAQEVFRLRDLPAGGTRRAALRNWVESHWRKNRGDAAESLKVRQHLRGATSFVWNGLKVDIAPSLEDQQLNQKLAAEAKLNR